MYVCVLGGRGPNPNHDTQLVNDGREIQGGPCSAWTELGRRGKQKLRDLFQKGEHGCGKPRLARVGAGKLPEHAELDG